MNSEKALAVHNGPPHRLYAHISVKGTTKVIELGTGAGEIELDKLQLETVEAILPLLERNEEGWQEPPDDYGAAKTHFERYLAARLEELRE